MMTSLKKLICSLESDVTKYTAKGNIVGIIFTGYDHNYYLAKLITNIHETGESGVDDNNHERDACIYIQKVTTCSYLEIIKI